jgi:hypothetical protein
MEVEGEGEGHQREGEMEKGTKRRTEDQDIKDQNNKTEDSSTGAVFPGVAVGGGSEGLFGHGEGDQEEVEQD